MPDTFRVTTYDYTIALNTTSTTVTLNQDLESNYFVMIMGSNDTNSAGPDHSSHRLTSDPFGTGDLSASGATDEITIEQNTSVGVASFGTVTVVECLGDEDASGFRLRDVVTLTYASSGNTTVSKALVGSWTDINQVVPFGGFRGGGITATGTASSTSSSANDHAIVLTDGPQTVNLTRNNTGATATVCTVCVYIVEWGSDWTVQHVQVTGSAGGGGADGTGEYDTAAIASATRAETFVWACGHTSDGGIGDSWGGALVALGDGVAQNSSETTVAVGGEYADTRVSECYLLSNSNIAVDWRYKADADSTLFTYDHTVDAALSTETYGADYTEGYRFGLQYNGCNGTGSAYPRPYWYPRHTASTTLNVQRTYNGQNWPSWVQSVDLSGVTYTTATQRRVIVIT